MSAVVPESGTRLPRVLLGILRCPITHLPLTHLDAETLEGLNAQITNKQLHFAGGQTVPSQIEEALVSQDGQFAYIVDCGIPIMLGVMAIALKTQAVQKIRDEVQLNWTFYQDYAWKKSDDGEYLGEIAFYDNRPPAKWYLEYSHQRVGQHLPPQGQLLLDVASGPVSHPALVAYSQGYTYRVCVDISLTALREAQRALGSKALCVLADATNLPFVNGVMDAAISLHTLYHIPADAQAGTVNEFLRTVKNGGKLVLVYCWGNDSLVWHLTRRLDRVRFRLRKLLSLNRATSSNDQLPNTMPPFYMHCAPYKWFRQQKWDAPYTLSIWTWASVDALFLQRYIRSGWLGWLTLKLIVWFENHFVRLAGRIGSYPMMVFDKTIG
jgi:SAM-dependent methyltransferase/uncharacterized protein YbaR (Trm112 family)